MKRIGRKENGAIIVALLVMELKAIIHYHKGNACYCLSREMPGIYNGILQYYLGPAEAHPPRYVTLIRGIRRWSGSVNDEQLLNQLGRKIEVSYFHSI